MTTLACVSGVDLLMDYLEGDVTGEVRATIEAHVAGCRKCAAFLTSYRATPRIIRDATAVELPDDVARSLEAALRARGWLHPDSSSG
jgi:anti-sigma factor RsiW